MNDSGQEHVVVVLQALFVHQLRRRFHNAGETAEGHLSTDLGHLPSGRSVVLCNKISKRLGLPQQYLGLQNLVLQVDRPETIIHKHVTYIGSWDRPS